MADSEPEHSPLHGVAAQVARVVRVVRIARIVWVVRVFPTGFAEHVRPVPLVAVQQVHLPLGVVLFLAEVDWDAPEDA